MRPRQQSPVLAADRQGIMNRASYSSLLKWAAGWKIEENDEFPNKKRISISFLPNDPTSASFLEEAGEDVVDEDGDSISETEFQEDGFPSTKEVSEWFLSHINEDEKKSGASPLSQHVATLRQRAQQRNDSLMESSVLVGDHSSAFGSKMSENDEDDDNDISNEEGIAVFNSLTKHPEEEEKKEKKKKKRRKEAREEAALGEDVVEDLILNSDDEEYEEDDEDMSLPGVDGKAELTSPKRQGKKQKPSKLVYGKKSNDVIVTFWEVFLVTQTDRGVLLTRDEHKKVAEVAQELGRFCVDEPVKCPLIFGEWDVVYCSVPTSPGGGYRSAFGRLVFKTKEMIQFVEAPDTVRNRVSFSAFGFLDGEVSLEGKLKALDEKWIQVVFEPPQLKVGALEFQYGGQSEVKLEITYIDDKIRLGKGSRGSLFVFQRL
ncbi:hypothetical protein LOK49_LG10G01055 [Camellia lanceoleosa]|uniref:Uncharacterized protein n=1 Tax=Camellia lanceoleosa TaxID=1840588 RepID=A0ACC0GC80_9ERIC|nr:hypothetical protein LOK49_LG10G01055 [Camellia lanceoleosa]